MKKICITITSLFLFACAGPRQTPAPIENASVSNNTPMTSQPGEAKPVKVVDTNAPVQTQITKFNDDDSNEVPAKPVAVEQAGVKPVVATETVAVASGATIGGIKWVAPINSTKIIKPYSVAAKGIDVAGVEGEAIKASDDGVVAYSGKGPDGYGLLIILKHKDNYLTAYSHNKVNLVKKDDIVKQGQKIAEVGSTDAKEPMLHFELRQHGKPVNPSKIFQ